MTDTVIVSGGMIQKDFALDFLKKLQKENKDQKLQLVAADRGLDFFRETGLVPDLADGDFDSVSAEGKAYLDSLTRTRIMKLQPEKDDTDTQSALNLVIDQGAQQHFDPGSDRRQAGPLPWQSGTSYPGKTKRREGCPGRRAELYLSCGEWNQAL